MAQVEVVMYPDGRMDTANASKYIGFSDKTLANMRATGTGPAFVKRGKIFYFKEDVDVWMRAGRVTSTAQRAVESAEVIEEAEAKRLVQQAAVQSPRRRRGTRGAEANA